MKRRALLSATASALFVAGCGQRSPESQTQTSTSTTDASTTTTSTTESTTTTTVETPQELAVDETASVDGGSVRVSLVQAQRSVYALDVAHHTAVSMPPASQFVLAIFQTTLEDGHDAARAHTLLELDDERYAISDHAFPPAGGGFRLAYDVPVSIEPTEGRLVWRQGGNDVARWRLSSPVLDKLANPPQFVVNGVEVPDTVRASDLIPVSVSVQNTGGSAGRFRSKLGVEGVYSELPRFERTLAAGETATMMEKLDHGTAAGETATVVFDWGLERIERTVEIRQD